MTPLQRRLIAVLMAQPDARMDYHALMHALWPVSKFPRAWRCSGNGGPPGCAIAFGRVLRELGDKDFAREWKVGTSAGRGEVRLTSHARRLLAADR